MKKRIAFISEHASPLALPGNTDSGGQNVYVSELAKKLAAAGYCIDIFTRKDKAGIPTVIQWKPNIRIIHIKAGAVAPLPKEELLDFMEEFTQNTLNFIITNHLDYAITHANFFMSAMTASAMKKKLSIPFVVTFHALGYIRRIYQGENDKFPIERIAIERSIMKNADCIIAECPQDREDMITYYGADPAHIVIIPCGFNPREFFPMNKRIVRTLLKLDPKEKYLLQLGRIVPRKGVDNVIRAVGRLNASGHKTKLLVVGGASEKPDFEKDPEIIRLQNIAKRYKIEDRVIFAGRRNRSDLKYYYAAADLFITTPWYEPFGITPLEAMACGTPIIGANVGGIKFTIENGKTGLLVPPDNPYILAKKIRTLFAHPDLMMRMRKKALKRVNALFTWSKVAHSVQQLYEDILQTKPAISPHEADEPVFSKSSLHTSGIASPDHILKL